MKKFKKPYFIKLLSYPEYNGTLMPLYINSSFPKTFKLKRMFLLFGKSKFFRANHAHKKCSQIIVPLNGSIKIEIRNKFQKKNVTLNIKNKKLLVIPPYNWIKIIFKRNSDSLLTLCNYKYDKKEYISKFEEFNKIINR